MPARQELGTGGKTKRQPRDMGQLQDEFVVQGSGEEGFPEEDTAWHGQPHEFGMLTQRGRREAFPQSSRGCGLGSTGPQLSPSLSPARCS